MQATPFSLLAFFGALAIFIYGIRLTQSGVQLLFGDRLRSTLTRLTQNRISALSLGAFSTLLMQSSNAVSITLVNFVANGTMTLRQAMGVLLGAGIGTTLVVLLISFPGVTQFGLLFLIGGILVDLLRQGKRLRYVSMVLMGFGFVFLGMMWMTALTEPLQSIAWVQKLFVFLELRPVLLLFVTILVTLLVQNSAAPIGLAIALSGSGLIDPTTALPIVLGANIGTCFGSVIASLGSNAYGKRLALAHLSLRVLGAALVLIFPAAFLFGVQWAGTHLYPSISNGGLIAASHLLFNLELAVAFLPFLGPAAWCIEKIIPVPREADNQKFRARFLDPKALDIPPLAFANVRREILRMLDLTQEMFRDCWLTLMRSDRVLLEAIHQQDDQIDLLDREIKFYLAKISLEQLSPEQGQTELKLVEITNTLEEIGDVITRNILELAEKKINKGLNFSESGLEELRRFHEKVLENFQLTAAFLSTEDEILARKVERHQEKLGEMEREFRQGHLNRLHQGLKETLETSSIHLDLLANFFRTNYLLAKVVRKAAPAKAAEA